MPEDIYVSKSGAGSQDGSNAANAHSLAWANDTANWGVGAGKVSPGDTLHLCGTFDADSLVIAASGTAGNIITILFETDANFTKGCWPTAGAIQLNDVEYITIDGGTNGLITNLTNGTGLATQNDSRGVGGNVSGVGAINHGVVRNLTVTRMYYKDGLTLDAERKGECIDLTGTDIIIENCYVSDGDDLIGLSSPPNVDSVDLIIRNNTLRNFGHGMVVGPNDVNSTITNFYIYGNDIDYSSTWDNSGGAIHLDGIIIQNNTTGAGSTLTNLRIYGNHFGPHVGTHTTAAIFNSMQNPRIQCFDWYVFNNLFECRSGDSWGGGFISGSADNMNVFNNSLIGTIDGGGNWGGSLSFGGAGSICKNNIIWSGAGINIQEFTTLDLDPADQTGPYTQSILSTYFSDVYSDYNIIVGANPGFEVAVWGSDPRPYDSEWRSGGLDPLTGWQTWFNNNRGMDEPIWNTTHADPNSTTTAPTFVVGTYIPASTDTQAKNTGVNLTSIFTEMGIPAVDYNGLPRPPTGPWTRGAFNAEDTLPRLRAQP